LTRSKIDRLAHACLQEGEQAATRNIHPFLHNDVDAVRARLDAIRAHDAGNSIMIVSESLFSMNSDTPDLVALQDLAHEFAAPLVVDVAHDVGSMGPGGRGHLGLQSMIGKVDLVMGSFSKTFASNGVSSWPNIARRPNTCASMPHRTPSPTRSRRSAPPLF
jgi:7-keto-8-aminopelargonate synthetase-like enzyme